MRIAEVAVNLPINSIYDYLIPEAAVVSPGDFVVVPVGPRRVEGIVVSVKSDASFTELKSISFKLDKIPPLSSAQLSLGRLIQEKFYNNPGPSYFILKPPGRGNPVKTFYTVTDKPGEFFGRKEIAAERLAIYTYLKEKGKSTKQSIKRSLKGVAKLDYGLNWLAKAGYIKKIEEIEKEKNHRESLYVRLGALKYEDIQEPFEEMQQFLFRYGFWCPFKDLRRRFGVTKAKLKPLEKSGSIVFKTFKDAVDSYITPEMGGYSEKTLTPHQKKAVKVLKEKISSGRFSEHLISGVTGSGKTEVYLNAAAEVLSKGKRAMILVPEISLTPQVAAQFKSRFGEKVMIYHSKQTAAEKRAVHSGILNNKYEILIGPRSVMLLPLKDLGLLVMDEFQDDSFKQNQGDPLYDGLLLAREICRINNALLLLASATPPVSYYHHTLYGEKEFHELPERAVKNSVLPEIRIINMSLESDHIISHELKEKIRSTLEKKEQIMLFYNRRGFYRSAKCKKCGYIFKCVNCDVPLIYHNDTNKMSCHYCGKETGLPKKCSECGSFHLDFRGIGIQRIQDIIENLFPDAEIARLDQDVSRNIVKMQDVLSRFRTHDIDILLGTQLIAKGMDFSNVTLVGVLSAEVLFSFPDYSTSERGFSLLMQVSGRAGRGVKKGEVLVQTYNPNNEIIEYSLEHNYRLFYEHEIKLRKKLKFPPFMRLYRITFSGKKEESVVKKADAAAEMLSASEELTVFGPMPAVLKKINNIYFYELMVKAPCGEEPVSALQHFKSKFTAAKIFKLG